MTGVAASVLPATLSAVHGGRADWLQVGESEHDGLRHSLWRHPSGATHLHRHSLEPPAGFGISFRTPATDDAGAAHVLEHLVGSGSRRYPMSSALLTASYRVCSRFANGFAETGRTSYVFTAPGEQDCLNLLDVLLDGLYSPLLRRRDFLREACRAVAPDEQGPARWQGVVYSEIALKPEAERQWFARAAAREFRPDDPAQYRHGGTPAALPTLEYEACVAFHNRYYRPSGAHSFAVAPDAGPILAALAAAHAAHDRAPTADTPPIGLAVPTRPAGSRPRHWAAARVRIPGTASAAWSEAVRVRAGLIENWGAREPRREVTSLVPYAGGVEFLAGEPTGGPDTSDAKERLRTLEAAIGDTRAETGGHLPAGLLHEWLGEPYQTMPATVSWGLALAWPRVEGHDPLELLGTLQSAAPQDRPSAEAQCSFVTDGLPAVEPDKPSAWRVRQDAAMWATRAASQDASGLPLRPLSARTLPEPCAIEPVAPGVERLGLPREHEASGRDLTHVLLPVDADTAFVVAPLIAFLQAAVPQMPLPPALARPRLFTRSAVVRAEAGEATVDLLFEGWAPQLWQVLATLVADTPVMVRTLAAQISRTLRERSATLLSAPHELAESAALAQVSPIGAAQDAVTGMPAMARWRDVSGADRDVAMAQTAQAVRRLAEAEIRLLVCGPRATAADAQRAAGRPAGKSEHERDPIRPVVVGFPGERRWHAHAAAWPVPDAADAAAAVVLGADLRRRYVHPRFREKEGVYTAYAGFDPARSALVVHTGSDPCGTPRRDQLASLPQRYAPPGDDDLETARLMAASLQLSASTDHAALAAHAFAHRYRPPSARELAAVTAADLDRLATACLTADRCRTADL